MLKRLHIDNFRCFVNFDYVPGRKQLLLGPNGSGKSSLLDAILFVKWFIEGDENHFTQSTRTRWKPREHQVMEIEAVLDGQAYQYRLDIRYSPDEKLPSVSVERLIVDGVPAFESIDGEIHLFTNERIQSPALKWKATKSALHLAQFSNSQVGRFMAWIETLHCFQIDPYPKAMDETAESEDSFPEYNLGNLAPWYRHLLQVDPAGNARFLTALSETLNGFQNLRFSTGNDGVRKLIAEFSAEEEKLPFSLSELSEGQRMLIGLYMILHFVIAKGETVILDEPDNFVSLREIQPWLIAAEEAVENNKGQLILISHHPEILNYWAREFGLLFSREENGHVRTRSYRDIGESGLDAAETIARGWENE